MKEALNKKSAVHTPAFAGRKFKRDNGQFVGTKGLVHLVCPCCGDRFTKFFQVPMVSTSCYCGTTIEMEHMARFEFFCECCEKKSFGRTNYDEMEITIPCRCGNPVTLKWDKKIKAYTE